MPESPKLIAEEKFKKGVAPSTRDCLDTCAFVYIVNQSDCRWNKCSENATPVLKSMFFFTYIYNKLKDWIVYSYTRIYLKMLCLVLHTLGLLLILSRNIKKLLLIYIIWPKSNSKILNE